MSSPKSLKRNVLCNCPQCGEDHYCYMWWTGKTESFGVQYKPKRVCLSCKKARYVSPNRDQEEGVSILLDIFDV